jgi:hypothetical protein
MHQMRFTFDWIETTNSLTLGPIGFFDIPLLFINGSTANRNVPVRRRSVDTIRTHFLRGAAAK